jgi:hypothetical protein
VVQTMRPVAGEIVNQDFIRQIVYDQTLFPHPRKVFRGNPLHMFYAVLEVNETKLHVGRGQCSLTREALWGELITAVCAGKCRRKSECVNTQVG